MMWTLKQRSVNRSARRLWHLPVLAGLICGATGSFAPTAVNAQSATRAATSDADVVDAREALRRGDRVRLASLRDRLVAARHPLALWVDYWELSARLPTSNTAEVEQFYQRWPGSYVEDRLRNDWLLELGRRKDWAAFLSDLPRFKMNDDREVQCYAHLALAQQGSGAFDAASALTAWRAQRDGDDGCFQLASHLRDSGRLTEAQLWQRLRTLTLLNRQRGARQVAVLLGPGQDKTLEGLWDKPARFLARLPTLERPSQATWGVIAVLRLAASDPEEAAAQLQSPWAQGLRADAAAAAWGGVTRQAALRLMPEASAWADRAMTWHARSAPGQGLTDEHLAWVVRSHLRATAQQPAAWPKVAAAIDAMSAEAQADPTWMYWKARALIARGRTPGNEALLTEAQGLMQRVSSPLHFYGQLALEQLGQRAVLPVVATALRPDERAPVAALAGLQRALRLLDAGLRSEGTREWNFSLIGMDDRQLMAAAHLACEREVWDRCIASSERTQREVDINLRYPLAFQAEIANAAQRARLDPALLLGLIRQESRFVLQARSHVGASGLMQVMPPTARWTAKRIGVELGPHWREDRQLNLILGTAYLRMVVDDFGGSLPMALSAYNAGPGRPRRWREGPPLEPAIWAETIPIHETRDYVKKVLSNTAVYTQRLNGTAEVNLAGLLGPVIGPRDPQMPEANKDLP